MKILSAQIGPSLLSVSFSDGSAAQYPFAFLKDNDPAAFHPQTQERVFDLLSIPAGLKPLSIEPQGDSLHIAWDGDVAPTILSAQWLFEHQPGKRSFDPADIDAQTWDNAFLPQIPRYEAAALGTNKGLLLDWLLKTKQFGLSIVYGLEDSEDAGVSLAKGIGFLRRTNFGETFRVETMADPNNLAYTAQHLPLHTDLPNQEMPPGYQFLHCVRNGAVGGESVFADSYHIAEMLKTEDRKAFDLLTQVPVPYRFHDKSHDIRVHRPVISLDERGRVFDVRYSAHLMASFDMEAELMDRFYRAYRTFMALTRKAGLIVQFKLAAGEMVVFDNRRTLHGRTSFDPNTGHRLLKGFYIDRGEFDSRIRLLSRDQS
jgi:gamma-butyrobetaine dioxygenase